MTFFESTSITVGDINSVKGTAFCRLLRRGNLPVLITGGDKNHVMFLEGDLKGQGYPLEGGREEQALIFDNVLIEVDLSSAFKGELISQPAGAFRRSRDFHGVSIVAADGHGFSNLIDVEVGYSDVIRRNLDAATVGFKKWRIVRGSGPEKITLFEFEADSLASY